MASAVKRGGEVAAWRLDCDSSPRQLAAVAADTLAVS